MQRSVNLMDSRPDIHPSLTNDDNEDAGTYSRDTLTDQVEVYNPFSPTPSVASSVAHNAVVPWRPSLTAISSPASEQSPYPVPLSRLPLYAAQGTSGGRQSPHDLQWSIHMEGVFRTDFGLRDGFERELGQFHDFLILNTDLSDWDELQSWTDATDVVENCWQCIHDSNTAWYRSAYTLDAARALRDRTSTPSLTCLLVLQILLFDLCDSYFDERISFARQKFSTVFSQYLPIELYHILEITLSTYYPVNQLNRQFVLLCRKMIVEHIEKQLGAFSPTVVLLKVRICGEQFRLGETKEASAMLNVIEYPIKFIEYPFPGSTFILSDDVYFTRELAYYLGLCYVSSRDFFSARIHFERSLQRYSHERPMKLWKKLDATLNLAYCNVYLGEMANAEMWLQEALQIRREFDIEHSGHWRMKSMDNLLNQLQTLLSRPSFARNDAAPAANYVAFSTLLSMLDNTRSSFPPTL